MLLPAGDRIVTVQVQHPLTKQVHHFWFKSPVVGLPLKEDAPPGSDTRLFPRDCREAVRTVAQYACAPQHQALCNAVPTINQSIDPRIH
jgi:hypothetical protein